MKHIYLFLLVSVLSIQLSYGQLPANSIAPDFTVTDINGETHNLYSYLDEGKVVILDLFAVWCGPCWNYHQAHILEDLYQEKGPDGTNEVVVLAIESDGSTAVECITGGCASTIGDWTVGVSYPAIDSRAVADAYDLAYYPTIYAIYPNRIVNEVGQRSLEFLQEYVEDAPRASEGANPSVIRYNGIDGSLCAQSWVVAPSYFIGNMGEENITSFDYEVRIGDEVLQSDSWSGSSNTYETMVDITVTPEILSENRKYDFYFTNINGETVEELAYTSSVTFNLENTVAVVVNTDEDSGFDANRYQILDGDGNILVYEFVDQTNRQYVNYHDLPSEGCYTFLMFDDGGDGIDGEVKVQDIAGNIIYRTTNFGSEGSSEFNVSLITDTEDLIASDNLTLTPNPATQNISLILDDTSNAIENVLVVSIDGRQYPNLNFDENSSSLDIGQIPSGVYSVLISTTNGTMVSRFVKQ